jgi:hypothetical protein
MHCALLYFTFNKLCNCSIQVEKVSLNFTYISPISAFAITTNTQGTSVERREHTSNTKKIAIQLNFHAVINKQGSAQRGHSHRISFYWSQGPAFISFCTAHSANPSLRCQHAFLPLFCFRTMQYVSRSGISESPLQSVPLLCWS